MMRKKGRRKRRRRRSKRKEERGRRERGARKRRQMHRRSRIRRIRRRKRTGSVSRCCVVALHFEAPLGLLGRRRCRRRSGSPVREERVQPASSVFAASQEKTTPLSLAWLIIERLPCFVLFFLSFLWFVAGG